MGTYEGVKRYGYSTFRWDKSKLHEGAVPLLLAAPLTSAATSDDVYTGSQILKVGGGSATQGAGHGVVTNSTSIFARKWSNGATVNNSDLDEADDSAVGAYSYWID